MTPLSLNLRSFQVAEMIYISISGSYSCNEMLNLLIPSIPIFQSNMTAFKDTTLPSSRPGKSPESQGLIVRAGSHCFLCPAQA